MSAFVGGAFKDEVVTIKGVVVLFEASIEEAVDGVTEGGGDEAEGGEEKGRPVGEDGG